MRAKGACQNEPRWPPRQGGRHAAARSGSSALGTSPFKQIYRVVCNSTYHILSPSLSPAHVVSQPARALPRAPAPGRAMKYQGGTVDEAGELQGCWRAAQTRPARDHISTGPLCVQLSKPLVAPLWRTAMACAWVAGLSPATRALSPVRGGGSGGGRRRRTLLLLPAAVCLLHSALALTSV